MKDSLVPPPAPAPVALFCSILIVLGAATASPAHAASDTDVRDIVATSVTIEEDRIVITGSAVISMRVFTPRGGDTPATSRLFGRPAAWVKILADEATFTVLRPKQGDAEWWEGMSVDVAKALKAGEAIGRIGFYRPEVVLKKNAIHAITGAGYLYPKKEE